MKLGYLSKMVLFVKQMVLKMKLVVLIRENTHRHMATFHNLYRKLLFVNIAFFNNMRIETDQEGVTSVIVTAKV